MEPASPSVLGLPPPPVASARGTLLSAGAVLMGRVHLALSRMHAQQGGSVVSIGRLREHLRDVEPRRIERALLELEAEGALALLPSSMGEGEAGGVVLLDELRGALGRIELRRSL